MKNRIGRPPRHSEAESLLGICVTAVMLAFLGYVIFAYPVTASGAKGVSESRTDDIVIAQILPLLRDYLTSK